MPIYVNKKSIQFDSDRTIGLSEHIGGDMHLIGEALPAPSQILAIAGTSNLGSSPIPAREDHVHGPGEGPLGERAYQQHISSHGPVAYTSTPITITFGGTDLAITYTLVSGRKYWVEAYVRMHRDTTGGVTEIYIEHVGSGTVIGRWTHNIAAGEIAQAICRAKYTGSGSSTFRVRMAAYGAGNITAFASVTQPMYIALFDEGAIA